MQRLGFLAIAVLALGGCALNLPQNYGAPVDMSKDMVVSCGAENLAGYIGRPQSELDWQRIPATTRVIGPGDRVTRDYVMARLNIYLDKNGIITQLRCG